MDIRTIITDAIKQNGNEEITGSILQSVLLSMVDALGLSPSKAQAGYLMLNDGQPLATSGEAEALAATRAIAGNPAITCVSYRFNGTNGIGNGFIEQNLFRFTQPTTGYQTCQVLRLNHKRFRRYISLASSPSADGIFDVSAVGGWTEITE